jgi:hypothetical protein
VKVQVSVVTGHPKRRALVYDETRRLAYTEVDVDDVSRHFMRGRLKAYFWADVTPTNVHIIEDAPDQAW